MLQLLGQRLVEEFPRHGYRWRVRCHVAFPSQDSRVAGDQRSPLGVLETHDDGERDGLTLTGLCGSRRNGNTGDDGLRVVRGVDWG